MAAGMLGHLLTLRVATHGVEDCCEVERLARTARAVNSGDIGIAVSTDGYAGQPAVDIPSGMTSS